ncbi:MAG: 1-hydroxycarotenoid 3,4-desaturase CrtD [Crocinitomicaceae bacterium]
MSKVIVIGGGIGGLATAIRLAAQNKEVVLFEKNKTLGGKLAEFSESGYRFDMGPSLFTMPEYFEDLFKAANKNLKDYLSYKKLNISCTYYFADGKSFVFYNDKVKLEKELKEKLNLPIKPITKYLEKSKKLYQGAGKLFIENSLHKRSTYFSKQALKALPQLINPSNLKSLHRKNKREFNEPKLVQLFDRYATYNGSSPYKTPAMMSVIPHLEHNIGAFFPKGGMFGIVTALEQLAEELGVDIRKGESVDALDTSGKLIQSAVINGQEIKGDLFVLNMDIALVYKQLLNENDRYQKEIKKERSSSGLVFYWGMNRSFPELSLHNILFSEDYEAEFTQIFKGKKVPTNPTIYINISSKEAPEDAPLGCENWFVMINTPSNIDLSSEKISAIRNTVLSMINTQLKLDVESHIVVEQLLTPNDIKERSMSMHGALYGTASNSAMSSFRRHPNFSKQYKNLYFVGGTVHPGGGIPLCLNSAKIVADLLC